MLDHYTILTQGGIVLFSRSFTPSPSPIDSLIREALIEQRTSSSLTSTSSSTSSQVSKWDKDQHSLSWINDNSLDLIFVVAYQRILNLTYTAEFLEKTKKSFVKGYGQQVSDLIDMSKGKETMSRSAGTKDWNTMWTGWDETFNKILKELEGEAAKNKRTKPRTSTTTQLIDTSPDSTPSETPNATSGTSTSKDSEPLDASTIARNIAALKARQKAAARQKGGKGGGKSGTDTESNAGSESDASPAKPKRPTKTATKWADSSLSAADLAAYDYSSNDPSTSSSKAIDTDALLSKDALGKRDKQGMYEVADYNVKDQGDSASEDEDETSSPRPSTSTSTSTFSSFFSRLSLSTSTSQTLTKESLKPVLASMQSHLISKNVASPIAVQLVESVGRSLEGKKVTGWGAIKKEVKKSVQEALTKVLTPKTSTDLLLEITRKRDASKGVGRGEPYAITFVGVNGVGKSTNLSKVAFWLLQNKLKVLIAACDTFRSGAVEQLRVHTRNLGKLGDGEGSMGQVELFEKGYGKDAAGIAKDALTYAKSNGFDVVLIDTAGRMQDNEPLMRALSKLISVNQPDKIIFVGEALVGNEAVDQLVKFDRSLRDFSASGGGGGGGGGKKEARGIDGMILTKFDTIDDKVGAALSMTYTTGQPIYFVGCGQTYSDLRMLRVGHIVQALLQD